MNATGVGRLLHAAIAFGEESVERVGHAGKTKTAAPFFISVCLTEQKKKSLAPDEAATRVQAWLRGLYCRRAAAIQENVSYLFRSFGPNIIAFYVEAWRWYCFESVSLDKEI